MPEFQTDVIIKEPDGIWQLKESNETFTTVSNSIVDVSINKANGELSFYKTDGALILRESKSSFNEIDLLDGKSYEIRQNYIIGKDDCLYGLGQFHNQVVNYRNSEILIAQKYLISVNPLLCSSGGYGLMWNNYSRTIFQDDTNGMSFTSDAGNQIDYYLFTGDTYDEIIACYRELTGPAPMFPKWVFGYQQCKCSYDSFQELQDIVSEYRKRAIPIDCIVQDYSYWGDSSMYSPLCFKREGYENAKEEIQRIHNMNVELLVSIWPLLGTETEIYKTLDKEGFMLPYEGCRVPHTQNFDANSRSAVDLYFEYLKKGLLDAGVDALWMDGTEPEYGYRRYTRDYLANKTCAKGDITRVLNGFSLAFCDGIYENYRQTAPDKRLYILTRSSFIGQQRDAAVTWSGDVSGEWKDLKAQVTNAINFTLSGIPYWSHDIGGWSYPTHIFPHSNEDKSFCELYTRWFAFGAFTSIFRSHGVKSPREMWQFGDEGGIFYDALVELTKLRYSLMSYIYSLSYQVTHHGFSIMRGMMIDFPADKNCLENNTQFMFGKELLVMPVTDDMCHVNPMYRLLDSEEYTLISDDYCVDPTAENYRTADFQAQILTKDEATVQKPRFKRECLITPKENGTYFLLVDKAAYATLYLDGKLTVNSEPNYYRFADHFVEIELKANHTYQGILWYTPMDAEIEPDIRWKTPSEFQEQMMYKDPTASNIYLPEGNNWYDYYTKQHFQGGQTIEKIIPLSETGLFVKGGSILPICEVLQYATQKQYPDTTIQVYAGGNGSFTLYEDENDNYNYEQGAYALTKFDYQEDTRTLYIRKREGSYAGMEAGRNFTIQYITPEGMKEIQNIEYDGSSDICISLLFS